MKCYGHGKLAMSKVLDEIKFMGVGYWSTRMTSQEEAFESPMQLSRDLPLRLLFQRQDDFILIINKAFTMTPMIRIRDNEI